MSWNYRVIERDGGFAIYEVFYDETGEVIGHTDAPVFPHASSLDDLADGMKECTEALQKAVLPY